MSKLVCPFCQQELEIGGVDGILRGCPKCRNLGTEMLWQELIRTRKALDVAVDAVKEIDELLSSNKFDVKEVPLLNITQTKISMLLRCINIEQITTLKQKKSAFAHNKIEFPEFNDNLLEEFNKQFFENGQDDDLTETALEQKDAK